MTTPTLATYFQPLRPHLDPCLISEEGLAAMARPAALLPARFGHNACGLEVRLGPSAPVADLSVAVDPLAGDVSALAALDLPEGLRSEHSWAIFGPLAERCGPGGDLHGAVANLWIEFDTGGSVPLLPSFHFMPAAFLVRHRQDHGLARERTARTLRTVCRETPDCLRGPEPLLDRAFGHLPPVASLFQIGVMNARPSRLVRVCAALHNRRRLLAYLEALGYPGDLVALEREVAWLRRYTDRLRFDLDLGTEVQPKIGIEAYIQGAGSRRRWREFLVALVRVGLATEAKAEALMSYAGTSGWDDHPETWPAHLRQASGFLGSRARLELERTLHHIKVVVEPGKPREAKAYLSAQYRWR